jgi:chorismate mutase
VRWGATNTWSAKRANNRKLKRPTTEVAQTHETERNQSILVLAQYAVMAVNSWKRLTVAAFISASLPYNCQAFAQQDPTTTTRMKNRWGPKVPGSLSSSTYSSSSFRLPMASVEVDNNSNSNDIKHATALTSITDSLLVNNIKNDKPDEKRCVKTSDVLSLDSIRNTLIRQEETIIFALIERAQFRHNAICYQKGAMGQLGIPPGSARADVQDDGSELPQSFLEYMLVGTEALHCGARRYTSPEEHAFFPKRLPSGIMDALEELDYPNLLSSIGGACDVNFNPILLEKYINVIVPAVSVAGDDEQHGSTVLCDIALLQALSRRVHYGKFVAESKYRDNPEGYQALIDAGDADGVMALLTNAAVEEMVLRRARLKAATYGQEPLLASLPPIEVKGSGSKSSRRDTTSIVAAAAASAVVAAIEAMGDYDDMSGSSSNKVNPSTVEAVYRDIVIPLTKDVEVNYLFLRCGRESPPEYQPHRMSVDVTRLRDH